MAKRTEHEKFTERMRNMWANVLHGKLLDRLELICPCPHTALQLYKYGWTPEQRQALLVLSDISEMISTSRYVNVTLPNMRVKLSIPVTAKVRGLPYGRRPDGSWTNFLKQEDLPEEMYSRLWVWSDAVGVQRERHRQFAVTYERTIQRSANIGQFLKAWPDMEPLYRKWSCRSDFPRRVRRVDMSDLDTQQHGDILASVFMLPEVPFRHFEIQ